MSKQGILTIVFMLGAGLTQAQSEIAGVLFSAETTNRPAMALPLKNTDVRIEVTAGIARTEVVQRFRNDLDEPLEAVYIFPLPSEAAIDDFEIQLKDRTIRSTVKEREEARQTYEAAKREGRKAALMEQERPNLFTTSVANLLPGEEVAIRFTYVEMLRFRRHRYDISFPMVAGERYIPFRFTPQGEINSLVEDAGQLNPPVLHPNMDSGHRLSIEVVLNGLPIDKITSNTHAIDVRNSDRDHWTVSLSRKVTVPDCVFNIAVDLRKEDSPALSFVQSRDADESYGLLSVFPPIETRTSRDLPRNVVFLIDTSGSMSGESIGQAQSGLRRCLNILKPEDRFTIVRFASEFSSFSPELRDAVPDRLDAARDYIRSLDADGGTEMQPALQHVLELLPDDGRMNMILFLTDGDVGNEDSLIALLADRLGRTRLFTFGIGSAPNEYLLHRMAETGRGQSRFIRSHEDIGDVMADFFHTLSSPVLTDVSVEWDQDGVQMYPDHCPDIYRERPLQIVARSGQPFSGSVKITGTLDGIQQEYVVGLDRQDDHRHDAINRLYGRMKIKELMVQRIQADSEEEKEKLKQAVIQTALKHQLISGFTSRIAVEERVTVENGELVTVRVPVESPKGWRLHATATRDPLLLLIGLAALSGAALLRRKTRVA
jgi:Ca-activated chloride channel family protein